LVRRLQELGRDTAVGRRLGRLEEGLWHVAHERLRPGLDQEIFLFDSERERTGHAQALHFWSFCEGIVHWVDHRAVPATVDAIRTKQRQGEKGGQITPLGQRSSLGENDFPSKACGGRAFSATSAPARSSTPGCRA